MTRKFERVLSNEDLLDVYRSLDNPKMDRDSVIEAMGAAVDAAISKLAEQEPVAWTSSENTSDKSDTERLDWLESCEDSHGFCHAGYGDYIYYAHQEEGYPTVREVIDAAIDAAPSCVSPTSDKTACVSEKAESETQASSQVNLGSSNQVDNQELPPLPEPNCKHGGGVSYFDSYSKEQMIEYAKSAIEHHRTAKNYIPDTSKTIAPEGYALVPVEITAEMLRDAHIRSELGAYAVSNLSEGYSLIRNLYDVLVSSAPKYTGESK